MQIISEIISSIAKKEGLSIRSLEELLGTSQGVLSKIVKNNGDLKVSILRRIKEVFPHYNSNWLLTGKGEMLKESEKIIEPNNNANSFLLGRIEQLAIENNNLKQEIQALKTQKNIMTLLCLILQPNRN